MPFQIIRNDITMVEAAAVITDAQQRGVPALVIECAPEQQVTQHIAKKHGFRYAGEENGLAVYRRDV